MSPKATRNLHPKRQRGYSLIELSVAMAIALFLLGGLFSILQTTRKTSGNQTLLSQLQDNERIAMTLLTETIQQAGYYPNPSSVSLANAFPTSSAFATAGQTVAGSATNTANAAGGDVVTVRYQAESTSSVLGCLGTADSVGPAHEYQFSVSAADTNGVTSLVCVKDGAAAVPLVPGVTSIKVWYGVDTTGVGNGVNAYVDAGNMTSTYWLNVYSVQVIIQFTNPLANQPGQPATVTFTRVINITSRTGSNISSFT